MSSWVGDENPTDMTDEYINNRVVTLRGLSESRISEIVKNYEDFNYVPFTNELLLTISERYCGKLEFRYSVSILYKCFYWYLYSKTNKSGWRTMR